MVSVFGRNDLSVRKENSLPLVGHQIMENKDVAERNKHCSQILTLDLLHTLVLDTFFNPVLQQLRLKPFIS
jgi:hypothetical protein